MEQTRECKFSEFCFGLQEMHPLSRVTRQETKKYTHEQKVKRSRKMNVCKYYPELYKLRYFQKQEKIHSLSELREIAKLYINHVRLENKFFADIEERAWKEHCFKIPDLISKKNYELLAKWNGNKSHSIKFSII
eukprot:NODE_101_length_19951_cov_0.932501.p16 type:complete len:134 gc:universal NODE_101_length_19951_cov_0.932501:11218-11619(+)